MKNQVTGSSDRESRGTNAGGAAGTGLDLFLHGLACSDRLLGRTRRRAGDQEASPAGSHQLPDMKSISSE